MHRTAPYSNYSTTRLRSNRGVTMIKRETGSRTMHAIEPLTINRNVQEDVREEREREREVLWYLRGYTYTRINMYTCVYTYRYLSLPEGTEGIFFSRSPLGRVTRIYVSPVSLSAKRASLIKRLRDETGSDVLPSGSLFFRRTHMLTTQLLPRRS